MRWSPQKSKRAARERAAAKIVEWKEQCWLQLKARAQKEKRTIVFVDESGLTEKPAAKSTWAPVGQTPVLELNFHWKKLSVIGGITIKNLYFQLHKNSVTAPEVVGFLQHLQQHIAGKLLVIWDGLPAHRSDYLAITQGRVWVERLLGYAPEINPIEIPLGLRQGQRFGELRANGPLETESRRTESFCKGAQGQTLPAGLLDPVRFESRMAMYLFWNAQ